MANNTHKLLLLMCLMCIFQHTHAQQKLRSLSVISENDLYAHIRQDRHYTNGMRLGFGLDATRDGAWYRLIDRLAQRPANAVRGYQLAIGQNIYTPEFFTSLLPQPDDRPYAGWLYTELSTTINRPGSEESLAINLGVVGPAALGEVFQKLNHSIIGGPEPGGWDYQLKNEPALLLRYRRSWFTPLLGSGQVNMDLISRLGINLGNVFTDAGAGLALRLGNHLPERELPLRIQPGLSGNSSAIRVRKDRFDWLVFAGLQGRFVAQNIFLDGNTFRDSHSVGKHNLVRDVSTGLVLGFGQFRYPVFMSFSYVWRDREFDRQQQRDSFGSGLIGIQY